MKLLSRSLLIALLILLTLVISSCNTAHSYLSEVRTWAGFKSAWSLSETQPLPGSSLLDVVPLMIAGLPEDSPTTFLLDPLPSVEHQGERPIGAIFATGHVAFSILEQRRSTTGFVCSPFYLADFLSSPDRRGSEQPIESLIVADFLYSHGCVDIYHADPFSLEEGSDQLRRLRGYGRVDHDDPDQLRAHLLQGSAVIVTLRLAENFPALRQSLWRAPAGRDIGRHTMALVGYDEQRRLFILQNSFGREWGEKGLVEIPYEWLLRLTDTAIVLW